MESGSSTASMDPQQLWQVAQEELRFQVVRPGYEAWLANAVLVDSDGHTFTVGVPTMFARDWVSERYVPLIRETLSGVLGRDCEVIITVDPEASPPPEAPPHVPDPTYAHVSEPEDGANDSRLNPAFTFSTFVVGNSSRFAHAACRAVAEAPGKAYNPLFLYGGVGLGKTHLMHAIGHAVRETHRNAKVAYVTSEKFMNEMVASIVENRPAEFRMRYRGVDVLLIDDIQFLAGKDHTREEFFHTFNALQEFQKQIVVSSDRPPKDIPTLEDRLRSRFEGGLMADIQPPGFRDPPRDSHHQARAVQQARPRRGLLVHRAPDPEEHPRARGSAHPRARACVDQRSADHSRDRAADPPRRHPGTGLDAGQHRDHPDRGRRALRHLGRGDEGQAARQEHRVPASGRDVPHPRGDRVVAPRHRQRLRGRDHTTALHAIEKITELMREDVRLQGEVRAIREQLHNR